MSDRLPGEYNLGLDFVFQATRAKGAGVMFHHRTPAGQIGNFGQGYERPR
jgi:hypothetical protein